MKVRQAGQSLVEVVIALAIVVLVAIALISTNLITQKSTRSARNNTQAAKYAQEGIEQMRAYRDRTGIQSGDDAKPCVVVDTSRWVLNNCADAGGDTVSGTIFARKIKVDPSGSKEKKITVTVSWSDSAGSQFVVDTTRLRCDISNSNNPADCP